MAAGFELVFETIEPKKKAAPEATSATCDVQARKDLLEAISRLDQGQIKAAVRCAADAVNRMAIEHNVHGWARY